ncbi:asparagine synthase (glutamine-hydrolyzing) [Pelosinus propionicus]|uniref:asparagine synthase (glutamine-hydrolyzing) n=1 Tax=Pelosinus propionicus DSM 13327 TaxID=1123291 RepID=A0A1I4N665_9FIRM|nr:asparagine synthase (glutamine-hydrolyzing) [Pelosinus propionicus]SFM10968.1 asparagine synthase (glutamine-hydrolysing) [Pelosinus propionicus DSM 13327]
MCGIVGWIDWERNLENEGHIMANMMETLAARGPDASGMYLTKHAALGHRRLSVVDLENGAQPMIRDRGQRRYVITYNGELYNTPELRQALEALGYVFRTNCDTEVLLTAYIEWGPSCVEKFNGIFAFGIWDETDRTLFLARDRIGVKPLFYTRQGSKFIFGSELKALLAHPEIKPEIDSEGLAEVLIIGPARTPGHGVFRNIAELRPGHSMLYSEKGMYLCQYWALESMPHPDDFDTTVETVRELMQDIVKRQLVADVPVCTLLSGGLDSSALTALACSTYRQQGLGDLHTYSVDYLDNAQYFQANSFQPNADAPWVQRVSEFFDTRHHNIILDTPELAGSLPQATISRDLPGMADVDTSLYLFCREIKKGATVALSGECADEVFGGYPWFYREDMINASCFPWSPNLDVRMQWLSSEMKSVTKAHDYLQQRYQEALAEVPRLPGEDAKDARMREIFYLSLTRWMPTLLDRKDRMSMASGLEVRVPYCDHRLVEYVWNVPWHMKNFHDREKGLLRQALVGILPEDVLWRRKSPYPKTHNPSYLNAVRLWVLQILDDTSSPLRRIVDVDKVRAMAQQNAEISNIPWFGQLMSSVQLFAYLIQVDTWLREYKVQLV